MIVLLMVPESSPKVGGFDGKLILLADLITIACCREAELNKILIRVPNTDGHSVYARITTWLQLAGRPRTVNNAL
jgi:hypothetical protein